MTEEFEQPGPGGWMLLGDHFPGALTAEYQRLYAETCPPGMASYMERYGVLAKTIDVAFVHGHLYITRCRWRVRARCDGPRRGRWCGSWRGCIPRFEVATAPPGALLPTGRGAMPAAIGSGPSAPTGSQRNQSLQDVDPSSLDDDELRTHLRACRAHVVAGYRRHFELHGDDLLPLGLLLARCAEWGVDAATASRASGLDA